MKIAINGFGRIGRVIARVNAENSSFDIVNINDIVPSVQNMAYLFKYDSTYGRYSGSVLIEENYLNIDGNKSLYSSFQDIREIPFADKIDVLIDSSGDSKNINLAKELVNSGKIKKYIFTMSSNLVDEEIIYGINETQIDKSSKIFSSSICDANAIAHFLNLIDTNYGIISGSAVTLHPWLSYQNLLDGAAKGISPDPNKYTPSMENNSHLVGNFALGRSSVGSIIPKETTAISATEKVLKNIHGKIMSFSYRIPTATVASASIFLNTSKIIKKDSFLNELENLSKNKIIKLNFEHLTSKDYEKEQASSVIDVNYIKINKNQIQFILWYDNEWGYSSRVLDLATYISQIK
tara:strand:+ start:11884 stop:12933 length:1050 start_codon:yes stop_codon:yes gene_type:complete